MVVFAFHIQRSSLAESFVKLSPFDFYRVLTGPFLCKTSGISKSYYLGVVVKRCMVVYEGKKKNVPKLSGIIEMSE